MAACLFLLPCWTTDAKAGSGVPIPPYTSPFMRTLLDDPNAYLGRMTIGIPAAEPNAYDVPYFATAVTVGSKPVSIFAWSVLNAIDASSWRTLLEVTTGDVTGAGLDNLFSGVGLLTRTGAETYTTRSVVGTSGQITVADGNGVGGDPTFSLPVRLAGVSKHLRFNIPEPNEWYDRDGEICLWPQTDAALQITNIELTCNANPGTELDWNLKSAATFIGLAGAAVIAAMDTTAGVYSSGALTANVAASKAIYLSFDARPDAAITQICVDITYDYDAP